MILCSLVHARERHYCCFMEQGLIHGVLLQQRYKEETFVHVMDKGGIPHTRHVRGSNYNLISVFPDRLSGRAIIISGVLSKQPPSLQDFAT